MLVCGPVSFVVVTDSVPAQKTGLLKKLAQALQFRKRARAREQARVLDIIARSGLKDSLEATVHSLTIASDTSSKTTDSLQAQSIREVLNAIDTLEASLKRKKSAGKNDAIETPSTQVDVPVDDQDIQSLVNQVISPIDDKAQARLLQIRQLLRGKLPQTDTVLINDTMRQAYSVTLHNRASILGFYPYTDDSTGFVPDLRLVDELAWYAVGFKGATGELTGLKGWLTSKVIDTARKRGCAISLCVMSKDGKNIHSLLRSAKARQQLIDGIGRALQAQHADGVYILFGSLDAADRNAFTSFIGRLAEAIDSAPRPCRIGVRVPAYDVAAAYDLPALNAFADRFLLDFTQPLPGVAGPLAPLTGAYDNDLKTCISRCLNLDIPPGKLIACLPYYGVIYPLNRHGNGNPYTFIAYKDIRSNPAYLETRVYNPASATEQTDVNTASGHAMAHLWFDDGRTLAAKYDFILQNKLGGVAIQSLGYDWGYGELWDVLASKFAVIDTTETAIRNTQERKYVIDTWQWSIPFLSAKLEQYEFLFAYPCETTFPKVLQRKWEKAGVKNNRRNDVRYELALVLGMVSIVLLLLFVGGAGLFISKMRRTTGTWNGKKALAGILMALFVLLTMTLFMFLFLDNLVTAFGVSDSPQDCFDFPFGELFIIIGVGIGVGFFITRFFVFPLIKKEDTP